MTERPAKRKKVATRNVAVELPEQIRRRLKMFAATADKSIKGVVNEALDEYLKKRGA